eukprot:6277545-Amphidinium_carterae.1
MSFVHLELKLRNSLGQDSILHVRLFCSNGMTSKRFEGKRRRCACFHEDKKHEGASDTLAAYH